jgi:cyclase
MISLLKFSLAALLIPAAFGQILLDGEWQPRFHEDQPERIPGPDLGDFLGLPLNDASRLRAESWNASRVTLMEEQCRVHVSPYIYRGPLDLRIWTEKDPDTQRVIAIKNYISTWSQTRTIWMDGRPHPAANAPHTWMGFSTGEWHGDILTVHTSHIKYGWLRRNGVVQTDQATMTEHFIRHGDYMTHVMILEDPAYLTEPLIKTEDFAVNQHAAGASWVYNCRPVKEIISRDETKIPHYLPGENPFLGDLTKAFGISGNALHGGAETMYPEYRLTMRRAPVNATLGARVVPAPAEPTTARVTKVQGNIYVVDGVGANVVLQSGNQGLLMVDTGTAAAGKKLLDAARTVSAGPIRWLLNTGADPDHIGGNEAIANAAGSSRKVELVNTPFASAVETIEIIAQDSVMQRMANTYPSVAWPTETFLSTRNEVFFNGEAAEMIHTPAAHSDADSIVFFRRSDVIAIGDLMDTDHYPVIDLAHGGSLQGLINGLNQVLALAIPAYSEEGGTMIIPGHGRICDEIDVVEYRDMLTIIRDRMQAMIKKGMTQAQIQAARPTLDYDPLFGATSGPWTTAQFVEAAYKSLTSKR